MTKYLLCSCAAIMVTAFPGIAQALLLSVDFQTSVPEVNGPVDGLYVPFVTMSGVEPFAAAADADFNAADVWNVASLTSHFAVAGSSDTNPSWSGFVDSTGLATTAAFSITGSVVATEVLEYVNNNALNQDGLAFDVPNASASLEWQIAGLVPGTPFKLFLNQLDVATWGTPPVNQNRAMKGFIDTNGDGTASEAYQMNFPGVLVTGTVAADGIIRGTSERAAEGTSGTTEPDWAGFQLIAEAPLALTLQVDTASGEITLVNSNDQTTFDIDYYEILSLDSLDENGWTRLAGQTGFPPGDGTGNGWEDAGNPDEGFLGEVFLDGSSTIGTEASISLGSAYNEVVDSRDLVFNYVVGDQFVQGNVTYVESEGLAGDFNNDGVVDAADYTVWRNNLGAADESAINNNGNGGGITAEDYTFWKERFGNTSMGSLLAAQAVPEPTSTAIATVGLMWGLGLLRRRSRQPRC